MATLQLTPSAAGYAYEPGSEIVEVKLDGGRAYRRKTKEKSTAIVNATWVLDPTQYSYFWAFYRQSTTRGASTFTLTLSLEDQGTVDVTAAFIGGRPTLDSKDGDAYTVSSQLEITLPTANTDADTALINLFGIYGLETGAWINRFEQLMNFDVLVLS
jgi:hypothetical protein